MGFFAELHRLMETKLAAYGFLILAGLLGPGSLAIYLAFLYFGSLSLVDLGLSEPVKIFLNTGLCLLFFIQHSGMTRKAFRRWLKKYIKEDFLNALYTIVSGLVLLLLITFWQDSSLALFTATGSLRWIFRGIFFIAAAGMIWGSETLNIKEPFGITRILRYLYGANNVQSESLIIRGPYRWIRHPMYFFNLLFIWSCPELTVDKLLFNILFTFWIIIGTFLEERDLVSDFGDAYRDYQRRVPRLFPHRGRRV